MSKEENKEIGQRIKLVRDLLGIRTVKELAELTNWNINTLYGYESGVARPAIEFLEVLKIRYGVNPKWILDGDGDYITDDIFPQDRSGFFSTLSTIKGRFHFIALCYGGSERLAKDMGYENLYEFMEQFKSGMPGSKQPDFWKKYEGLGLNPSYIRTGRGSFFTKNDAGKNQAFKMISEVSMGIYNQQAIDFLKALEFDGLLDKNELAKFQQLLQSQHGKLTHSQSESLALPEPSNTEGINAIRGMGMRVYLTPANAGFGFTLDDMPAGYDTRPLYPNPDVMLVVPVSGDSMEPEIKNGDRVFVDTSREPQVGDIVLCNVDGVNYVKWYMSNGDEKYLTSENPHYEPIKINGFNTSKIYGVVVDIVRRPQRKHY